MAENQNPQIIIKNSETLVDEANGILEVLKISYEHHSKLISNFSFGFISNATLFASTAISALVALLTTSYGADLYHNVKSLYHISLLLLFVSTSLLYTTKYMVYLYSRKQFDWYKKNIMSLYKDQVDIGWPSHNGSLGAAKAVLAGALITLVAGLIVAFWMVTSYPPPKAKGDVQQPCCACELPCKNSQGK